MSGDLEGISKSLQPTDSIGLRATFELFLRPPSVEISDLFSFNPFEKLRENNPSQTLQLNYK